LRVTLGGVILELFTILHERHCVTKAMNNEQNLANRLLEIKHFLIYTIIMNNHIPCCTELDNTIITIIHSNQADSMP